MSFFLRTWLLAITILILAEDFQYMLRVAPYALEQAGRQQEDFQESGDCENSKEKEDEQKEEQKEKDENKNDDPESLLEAATWLAKNKFRDAFYQLADIAHELESPPPERI